MGLLSMVPKDLIEKNREEDFLTWLKIMPLAYYTKKYIIIEWYKNANKALTKEIAERVGIEMQA